MDKGVGVVVQREDVEAAVLGDADQPGLDKLGDDALALGLAPSLAAEPLGVDPPIQEVTRRVGRGGDEKAARVETQFLDPSVHVEAVVQLQPGRAATSMPSAASSPRRSSQ